MKPTLFLLLAAFTLNARAETPADRNHRMQWWREARFGLFVHFGLYSIPAGQWKGQKIPGGGERIMSSAKIPLADYEKLAAGFNPAKFDARQWVHLARDSGMKYLVVTAKHHDGFCLWPSKVSTFTVGQTPFNRDPLKELADACKADGTVRLCLYYSITDWHHPDAQAKGSLEPNPNFPKYVSDYLKPQLKELIENYDPGVLWFDGEQIPDYTEAQGRDIDAYCRQLSPKIILNNRVGKSRKGMSGLSADEKSPGDFATPEQEIPPAAMPGIDWETCMTINDTWGYKTDDAKWKPARDLVRNLVDVVSKGGNYLLNVGPTAEGEIPPESVKRLQQVGDWMKRNHAAIHGAKPGPFKKWSWGRATIGRDAETLHLHVFVWPNGDDLVVPLFSRAAAVGNFQTNAKHDGLHLFGLPEKSPDPLVPVIALKLEGPPKSPDPLPVKQKPDGSLTLHATDCDVHATNARMEKGKNPPNIGYWTNLKDHVTWDAVIDAPGRFTVDLDYSLGGPAPGSEINIEFGEDKAKAIPVTLAPGKDFLDFRTIPLGQIDLPAGPMKVTVRPVRKTGVAVMDLRTITLKPVKQ